jgi:hypothetical protein
VLLEAMTRWRDAQRQRERVEAELLPGIRAAHRDAAEPLVAEALQLAERLREIGQDYRRRRRAAESVTGHGDPHTSFR